MESSVGNLIRKSTSASSVADFGQELNWLDAAKNIAYPSEFADRFENLSSASDGAKILFATDDWFAVAENLLQDDPPLFDPDAFCEQGKVLDGWETRRRRRAGHDWCLVQLPKRSEIHAVELDTAHFTGNNVPNISLELCDLDAKDLSKMVQAIPGAFERMLHGGVQGSGHLPEDVITAQEVVTNGGVWKELLPVTPLEPGFEKSRMHSFELDRPMVGNLVRINYFPDGGVARFRAWGSKLDEVKPPTTPLYMCVETCKECTVVAHTSVSDPSELPSRMPYEHPEVSSLPEGGSGGACSNKHYGEPWRLIQTNLGTDMGDGWETARHPNRPGILKCKPGSNILDIDLSDWAILGLGRPICVSRIILDTKHFRGNFPESVEVEGCNDSDDQLGIDDGWFRLIPRSRMNPDAEHVFESSKDQVENADKIVTHVRVSIFPDGGLSRVRVYGA